MLWLCGACFCMWTRMRNIKALYMCLRYSTAHKAAIPYATRPIHPFAFSLAGALLAKCDGVLRARLHSNEYYPTSEPSPRFSLTHHARHSLSRDRGSLWRKGLSQPFCHRANLSPPSRRQRESIHCIRCIGVRDHPLWLCVESRYTIFRLIPFSFLFFARNNIHPMTKEGDRQCDSVTRQVENYFTLRLTFFFLSRSADSCRNGNGGYNSTVFLVSQRQKNFREIEPKNNSRHLIHF